jgi:hypothetical protein
MTVQVGRPGKFRRTVWTKLILWKDRDIPFVIAHLG